jgi:hypothetical protein
MMGHHVQARRDLDVAAQTKRGARIFDLNGSLCLRNDLGRVDAMAVTTLELRTCMITEIPVHPLGTALPMTGETRCRVGLRRKSRRILEVRSRTSVAAHTGHGFVSGLCVCHRVVALKACVRADRLGSLSGRAGDRGERNDQNDETGNQNAIPSRHRFPPVGAKGHGGFVELTIRSNPSR